MDEQEDGQINERMDRQMGVWKDGHGDCQIGICVGVDEHIDEWQTWMDRGLGKWVKDSFAQFSTRILSESFLFLFCLFSVLRVKPRACYLLGNNYSDTKCHPQTLLCFFVFNFLSHGSYQVARVNLVFHSQCCSCTCEPPTPASQSVGIGLPHCQSCIPSLDLVLRLLWVSGNVLSGSGLSRYFGDFSHFVCSAKDDFTLSIHSFLALLSVLRKSHPQSPSAVMSSSGFLIP